MLPVILVVMVTLGFTAPVQADLVSLTIILATVWTSGVVVNETIISPDERQNPEAAKEDTGNLPALASQSQSD